jgi:Protein of unknown function (DUF2490)
MAWRCIVIVPLLSLAVRPAHGQRHTSSNWNSWYTVSGEVPFGARWGAMFDASLRRSGPLDQRQAAFLRGGLSYEISPAVRVAAGANLAETWPYGKLPVAYEYPERRTWQQLLLLQAVGRVSLIHRYRLEQRWQGRRGADTTDHRIDHWLRTSRARYQIRATLPLHGSTVAIHQPYLTAFEEIFVSFGANVKNNVFDQNRTSAAIGWRFSSAWRGEVGFLEQLSLKSDGLAVEANNTLTFGMSFLPTRREHSTR